MKQAELSKADMINGVPILLRKIVRFRPRVVCFVGKGIWEVFVKEATRTVLSSTVLPLDSPSTPGPSTPRTPSTPVGEDIKEEVDPDVLPSLVTTPKRTVGKKPKRAPKVKILFKWGIQPVKVILPDADHGTRDIVETLFFVMPSTSGRVVSHQVSRTPDVSGSSCPAVLTFCVPAS